TLALYLISIRAIVADHLAPRGPGKEWMWFLLAIGFPALLINVGHGQNGFLTAALMGGGLVLLERQPVAAGVLFGLMAYKPQFACLTPLVLLVSGRWRALASSAVTVAVLIGATILAFGPSVWTAFFDTAHLSRTIILEQGATGWEKIQSVF